MPRTNPNKIQFLFTSRQPFATQKQHFNHKIDPTNQLILVKSKKEKQRGAHVRERESAAKKLRK